MYKKKAVIWPYSERDYVLVKHENNLYEICDLCSPIGWGGINKDAGIFFDKPKINILIQDDANIDLDSIDIVIITKSAKLLNFNDYTLPFIKKIAAKGKNLLSLYAFDSAESRTIHNISQDNKISFDVINNELSLDKPKFQSILKISAPIIFVLSEGKDIENSNLEVMIYKEIVKQGYNAKLIGSDNYSYLWNGNAFPSFENKYLSMPEQIIAFNHCIKNIEIEEKCDVIIIGIPNGTYPIDRSLPNDFGLNVFYASLSITPDFVVYNVFHATYDKAFMGMLDNLFYYRYGYKIDCWIMNNKIIDWQNSRKENVIYITGIDNRINEAKINELWKKGLPFYLESEVMNALADTMNEYSKINIV